MSAPTTSPTVVTVTGAAGQIGYALLFRIASGQLLGPDTPVRLRLLEIPQAREGRRGHRDGARRLRVPAAGRHRHHRRRHARRSTASTSRCWSAPGPRTKGMERGDLLEANGGIFKPQGEAINAGAADDIRVLVVGNPANTNALIARTARPRRPGRPLHRDDAPGPQPGDRPARAEARRRRSPRSRKMTIWGNHSATQYPDLFHAEVGGKVAAEQVDGRLAARRVHPDRRQARRRDHRGPRRVVGGVGRERRDRPRPRLGPRHPRGRLDLARRSSPTAPTASPRA